MSMQIQEKSEADKNTFKYCLLLSFMTHLFLMAILSYFFFFNAFHRLQTGGKEFIIEVASPISGHDGELRPENIKEISQGESDSSQETSQSNVVQNSSADTQRENRIKENLATRPDSKKISAPERAKARKKAPKPENPGSVTNRQVAEKTGKTAVIFTKPAPRGGDFCPPPAYPELARKRSQEGIVKINCSIDVKGNVINVSIAQSSGYRLLDEAALATLKKWKFFPARKNNVEVGGSVVVPVEFRLK